MLIGNDNDKMLYYVNHILWCLISIYPMHVQTQQRLNRVGWPLNRKTQIICYVIAYIPAPCANRVAVEPGKSTFLSSPSDMAATTRVRSSIHIHNNCRKPWYLVIDCTQALDRQAERIDKRWWWEEMDMGWARVWGMRGSGYRLNTKTSFVCPRMRRT